MEKYRFERAKKNIGTSEGEMWCAGRVLYLEQQTLKRNRK
jgi:hypothetical protein